MPMQVVIIGTDIPDLTSNIITTAVEQLDVHDAVFGPALDGGYYLLALRKLHHRLFEDVTWSTASVLQDSLIRAHQSGLKAAPRDCLPALQDIDTSSVRCQHCCFIQLTLQNLLVKRCGKDLT